MAKIFRTAAIALAASSMTLSMPAAAAPDAHASAVAHANAAYGDMTYEHGKKKGHRKHYREYEEYGHYNRYDDRRYRSYSRPYYMGYDRYYGEPVYRDTRIWRGNDGRYYCRKENGTTGLLVGAGVGALIGHEVAGRGGDRTLGAILGAAGGALLGRAIDRSSTRCG
ncbi:glycine zipper 2TM domain-containing protein [Qipengyuania soli]|uniref:17 kDa surface antigen n=1 Tax=Qipengyuania soli TaxID=2782568 RepID=A0A7S8F5P2_9SPHN|nr:glycine zipper 2TM domain-containing protein [Qipengyuania soli]QPC99612.1 glycine zipper 2TM domain-containing protein [Qipengyuania soli]